MTPKEILSNLINGNLTDAQKGATHYAVQTLLNEAMGYGSNYNEGLIIASYLKGHITFQDYCDNMNNTK